MTIFAQLRSLELAGLIQLVSSEPELEYGFRHSMVREAAYLSLLRGDRRELHRVVGEALESIYISGETYADEACQTREMLPMLGHHFAEAGDNRRALKYLMLAGDEAAQLYANAEAIAHYTDALEAARPAGAGRLQLQHLFRQRGRAMELSGDYAAAMSNYGALEALGRERGERELELAGTVERALVYTLPTDFNDGAEAISLAEAALQLAGELGDGAAKARIHWVMLRAFLSENQFAKALAAGQRALALARDLNLPEQLGYALNDLSRSYVAAGDMAQARILLDEARHVWQALSNLPMLAESYTSRASVYYFAGQYDMALPELAEAERISRSIANAWGQAYCLMMRTFILYDLGQFSAALSTGRDCIRLSKDGGFAFALVNIPAVFGLLYAEAGAPEQALPYLQQAMTLAAAPAFRNERAGLFATRALVLLRIGQIDQARLDLAEASQSYNPEDYYSFSPMIVTAAECEILLVDGDYEGVVANTTRILNQLEARGMRIFTGEARRLRAEAQLALGQPEAARADLAAACELAEGQGILQVLWKLKLLSGEVESRLGNDVAARQARLQACLHVRAISAHIDAADLRQSFLAQPRVRAALAADDQDNG